MTSPDLTDSLIISARRLTPGSAKSGLARIRWSGTSRDPPSLKGNINAQEQADVMHELREGDFREAQQITQYDEASKDQVRQQEARYD